MTGFFADAFFSPGVFVESGSSVEAGLTFFLTGLFSGFSEISAVSSLLIGLEAFGRTGFPSASVSLRLFAGFAPAFFSVSFTFSASEPAADLLTGGFLAAGLSSAAPFLDTDDSAGLTATLLSALSTGFASACSASFFAAIFLARCLSRFHCFLQSRQTAYSLKIGSPDSVVPTYLFIRSSSLPHDGHFILIMYSSPCQ